MTLNRIILHADLDCFYCQVEQIRLNIPSTVPLVIQQWERIIAVNYAARSFGITRHSSYRDCLQACPNIKLVHVATYSLENDCELKQYEASESGKITVPDRMKFKASLDPYRKASLEILSIFKRFANIVEKASVDEAFLDVTKEVDQELNRMLQQSHSSNSNVFDIWSKLDWSLPKEDENNDNNDHQDKNDDDSPEMISIIPSTLVSNTNTNISPSSPIQPSDLEMKNEIRIYLAGKIASTLRTTIFKELGYTCSIGIAHNKMLAKLASAKNKPNKQTFVLNRQVEPLMKQVPLHKIRFLGGKMGHLLSKATFGKSSKVKQPFNSNIDDNDHYSSSDNDNDGPNGENENHDLMASDLWNLSVSDLQDRTGLDEDASKWVYNVIRGIDDSLVNSRIQSKSFQSTKNLAPAIKEWPLLKKWLPVLCTELKFRIEEDMQINNRWPQNLIVSFESSKNGFHTRSIKFPHDRNFKMELLVDLSERVLRQQQDLFPCTLIAIGVSRFTSINSIDFNNSSLDKFLVTTSNTEEQFKKFQNEGFNNNEEIEGERKREEKVSWTINTKGNQKNQKTNSSAKKKIKLSDKYFKPSSFNEHVVVNDPDLWKCPECGKIFPIDHIQEHQDYHFALSIQYRP